MEAKATDLRWRLPSISTDCLSPLARLDDKDKVFVEAYNSTRPLDMALIEERIAATDLDPEVAARAVATSAALPHRLPRPPNLCQIMDRPVVREEL
jgi:hypothetical protein